MRNFFRKLIYKVGEKTRSPKLHEKFKFLKETESWDLKELEEHQLSELKKLINQAYNNSAHYKKIFDENNFSPENIQNLKDITKLPILTKEDLLKNNNDIQINDGFDKMFFSETSGSSGEPLVFFRNDEWDAGHRAAQYRGYSWYDIKPWHRNGYFWGYNLDGLQKYKTKFLDFLMNRFRLFSYTNQAIEKFSKKLISADYLEGYSSMIYETAKKINEQELGPFNLKMVKGTSEKIFDSYQQEVSKAFGTKMISEYGAAETGIIAFECKKGNMHICMENVIVEEIDGEAIITNLLSSSFPIIRYKLGDGIILDKVTKCECGMSHYIIKDIKGRIGKKIFGVCETYPSLTLYYVFKNLATHNNLSINYQAVQDIKGEITVYLDKDISIINQSLVLTEFNKYFGNDLKVNLINESYQRDYNQKHTDFISNM